MVLVALLLLIAHEHQAHNLGICTAGREAEPNFGTVENLKKPCRDVGVELLRKLQIRKACRILFASCTV